MPLFRPHTHRLPKALTADELDALRAVPKNARDQALVETLAALHEVKKPYEKHFWKFERIEIAHLP